MDIGLDFCFSLYFARLLWDVCVFFLTKKCEDGQKIVHDTHLDAIYETNELNWRSTKKTGFYFQPRLSLAMFEGSSGIRFN